MPNRWSCGFTVARSDFRVRDATPADAPFSNSADIGASVRRASVTARRRRARPRPRPHDRFEDLRDAAGAYANSGPAQQLSLDEAEQDADDAARRVNDLIKGTRVGPEEADQLAAQRVWARAQRSLDAAQDQGAIVAAAQKLLDGASESELPVYAEELGSYLATRNVQSGWLSRAGTECDPPRRRRPVASSASHNPGRS
jgi:hypothetical protein